MSYEQGPQEPGGRNWLYDRLASHPWLAASMAAAAAGGGTAVAVAGQEAGPAVAAVNSPKIEVLADIGQARFNVSKVFTQKLVIGEDEHIKGVERNSPQCFETKGGFTNSMRLPNGKIKYYWDPVRAELCPDKNSPTGWVKVAGGTTGRHCDNVATTRHLPHELPISEVLNVISLNKRFTLVAKLAGGVTAKCGYVEGSFREKETFELKSFLRSKGSVQRHIAFLLKERLQGRISGSVHCTPQPPGTTETVTTPAPPVTTTTTTSTTTTTPPAPQPPTISMENMPTEGGYVNGMLQFCAEASSNPASDGVSVTFTSKYGEMSNTYADPDGDPNSYCSTESEPPTPEPDDQVFATATDSVNGKTASASSNPFPDRAANG